MRARAAGSDVLHVQYVAPPMLGLPIVVAVHDVSFEDRPDLFTVRTRLRLQLTIRRSVRRAGAVIALSAFTRDRLLHHHDLDPSRVFVARAGADGRVARPVPAADDENLTRLGLPSRYVLHVGDLIPRKNVPRLIQAMASLRRDGIGDVGLVLVGHERGDLPAVEAAIETAANGGDDGWVRRLGYVDDGTLHALYKAATAVAVPPIYEGFGMPALEALGAGAVLVTSASTALPEVVGQAAVLVDPEDSASLAAGLALAIGDVALRTRLAIEGPARAATFNWADCATATVLAYRRALQP